MSLGINNLDANLSSPAKSYLWEVVFPNPVSGDSETFTLRCQSASIPEKSLGVIKIEYKQTPGVKYPGKSRMPQTWPLTFVEGEDRAVSNAMSAWIDSIVNPKTGLGSLVVKSDIYLKLLNTDGETAQTYRMVGAYPETLTEVPLSYESETDVRYSVNFSYDRWELA